MCDYSLELYRSRPAQAGEVYETVRFPSGTVGLAAPGDSATAVCVACDTRVEIEGIPESLCGAFGIGARESVTFTRLAAGPHHDGVRFANGREMTLQLLGPGIKVRVVDSLLASPWHAETAAAQ